jgi:hypothetical protein
MNAEWGLQAFIQHSAFRIAAYRPNHLATLVKNPSLVAVTAAVAATPCSRRIARRVIDWAAGDMGLARTKGVRFRTAVGTCGSCGRCPAS